jgi:hypothetical protein
MAEITALAGLFGLSSAFALVGAVLAGWMAWRIVEKAGLPGWTGLGAVLLTLTAVGTVVPLILLWVFAFMRWPRDEMAVGVPAGSSAGVGHATGARPPVPRSALSPPPQALADSRAWRLAGKAADGSAIALGFDASSPTWLLTGATGGSRTDLVVPDPSVGRPHARLMVAGGRIGLADLGSAGGTWIDGARLLPEHGPRDITAVRTIRLGNVELALTRA